MHIFHINHSFFSVKIFIKITYFWLWHFVPKDDCSLDLGMSVLNANTRHLVQIVMPQLSHSALYGPSLVGKMWQMFMTCSVAFVKQFFRIVRRDFRQTEFFVALAEKYANREKSMKQCTKIAIKHTNDKKQKSWRCQCGTTQILTISLLLFVWSCGQNIFWPFVTNCNNLQGCKVAVKSIYNLLVKLVYVYFSKKLILCPCKSSYVSQKCQFSLRAQPLCTSQRTRRTYYYGHKLTLSQQLRHIRVLTFGRHWRPS